MLGVVIGLILHVFLCLLATVVKLISQFRLAKTADFSMLLILLEINVSTTKFCTEFDATI